MSSFASLSALLRAGFALWTLLLCVMNLGSAVLAAIRKRSRSALPATALLALSYFLWQVIFDWSLCGGTERAMAVTRSLAGLPWADWAAALVLLGLGSAALLGSCLRSDLAVISPETIKLYLDQVPCGVCCWRDSGRVLFSNVCMNRLCQAITNGPLLNGCAFREAVTDGILPVEDRVWRFSSRRFFLNGEPLHELIASDITTEYLKTQALERDKAELSSLNRELQDYYLSMDDMIRRQEILQARVNIHDEMNRLMLSTMAARGGDADALDRVFSLWEQNALLLGREAEPDQATAAMAEQLAAALGLRLIWQDPLPETLTGRQLSLFGSALQEAIVNAVKHAKATSMTISFRETAEHLVCRFTNDGPAPDGGVRCSGGLANLSLLAGQQHASVSASCGEGFSLLLHFPKDSGENQPIG